MITVAVLISGCAASLTPPSEIATQQASQPASKTAGQGWQLIGTVDSGVKYIDVVQIASTPDEWSDLWTSVGSYQPAPAVDLSRSIVASFAHVHGSNCLNVSLVDVVIDSPRRAIYSDIAESGTNGTTDCLHDQAGTDIYVVALDRSALPASPFAVSLNDPGRCTGANCQSVTVNLGSPEPTV